MYTLMNSVGLRPSEAYMQADIAEHEKRLRRIRGTGIMIIDMQRDFVSYSEETTKQLQAQNRLLEYSARYDMPVVVLEHTGYGQTLDSLMRIIGKVPRRQMIRKAYDDGFTNSKLACRLRSWSISNLCLTGVNASACVKRTAQGALSEGFTIETADDLIAEPLDWMQEKSAKWFASKGKWYNSHRDLISFYEYGQIQGQ